MMKNKSVYIAALGLCFATCSVMEVQAQTRIVLGDVTLMHEMRATPSPADGDEITRRAVAFQWPLGVQLPVATGLDGLESDRPTPKKSFTYKIRYSRKPTFPDAETVEHTTKYPFYNTEKPLARGTWYWQYGYVEGRKVHWSNTLKLVMNPTADYFCPPSVQTLLSRMPDAHPRVLVLKADWEQLRARKALPEYRWYCKKADRVMQGEMQQIGNIRTARLKHLTNEMQVKAYLTRESRRIIDKEETDCNALIRAYLLTKQAAYAREAMKRILVMMDWDRNPNVKGDFNDATLLSLASTAYDSFYDLLSADEKVRLLDVIRTKARKMYQHYQNRLENHIADNHVWQMTLRILTMAAVSVYGEEPEAAEWLRYCYGVWLTRMPGLNADGAWHNGDSYFTVNTRTLIELPYFYSRVTGFDFFADPWYRANVYYTMYQQPPFSKSGGNGSSHQKKLKPTGARIGYLDALARLTVNTHAADYVRRTMRADSTILKGAFGGKSADLSWFRLLCHRELPEGDGLDRLPPSYIFPESGLASGMTDWHDYRQNAMWSFRSSPYGSTSHALANQNAWNTFYGGESLFYSSGHHVAFIDPHSVYCHRGTRAHNTILVNGMMQRIGTEGYGWMPRWYAGREVSYVLGDASNAYGEVVSELWKNRAAVSDVHFDEAHGWGKNHVKTYRRHLVSLGRTGIIFVYDELEADEPVEWSYLLHAVLQPITVEQRDRCVKISTSNTHGISDAYLFSSGSLTTDVTDRFFCQPVSWLRADEKGKMETYSNHWHFTAKTAKVRQYRFATIVDTHAKTAMPRPMKQEADGTWQIGEWRIKFALDGQEPGAFCIYTRDMRTKVEYQGGATTVNDDGQQMLLTDVLPKLEI
uniref:DUF4962 domain-containing protein n=1 Tax=Prevotella sp. GTC17259 TaxID=3236795 RepID=A0AB33JD93_9BACT